MSFRKNEAIENGREQAKRYLLNNVTNKAASEKKLDELIKSFGPIVNSYPIWHPFVHYGPEEKNIQVPNEECGYGGLDHNVFFRDAFLSCSYGNEEKIVESVRKLFRTYTDATIEAEILEEKFYNENTTAVLVTCSWDNDGPKDYISKKFAVPLMLKRELENWRFSTISNSWEELYPYFLGTPCGKESSLFVDRDTGIYLKKIWGLLVKSGMFGPKE